MTADRDPRSRTILFVAVFLAGAAPGSAQAYIDPGVGSMVLQLLLGGVAGLLVVLKLYWHSFKALILRRKDPPPKATKPLDPTA